MAKKEIDSRSVEIQQPEAVTMPPLDQDFSHSNIVKAQEDQLQREYADALAMAEEPVMIRIEGQSGEFAPKVVDCWVNGKGAEMLQNGKWVEYGAFPIGYKIITKRKYVEALAMCRRTDVRTQVIPVQGQDPLNKTEFSVQRTAIFLILEDKNPLGREWADRILAHHG